MAIIIESTLYTDPQAPPALHFCPDCGGEIYRPGGGCPWCSRDRFLPLAQLSQGYRDAAQPLRQRLRTLRIMLSAADDPEQIWHIKRRIAELTPMLTEMNELAALTQHYYDRGYWRSEKYTL